MAIAWRSWNWLRRSEWRCLKSKAAGSLPAATLEELYSALFDSAQIDRGRKLGDEGGAAPVGAETAWIDRSDVGCPRRSMVAGESVAVTLAEIGVVITQVE